MLVSKNGLVNEINIEFDAKDELRLSILMGVSKIIKVVCKCFNGVFSRKYTKLSRKKNRLKKKHLYQDMKLWFKHKKTMKCSNKLKTWNVI